MPISLLTGNILILCNDRSILIHTAIVGYGREPVFEVKAPNQLNMHERIEYALEHAKPFIEAREAENAERTSRRQNKTKSRL